MKLNKIRQLEIFVYHQREECSKKKTKKKMQAPNGELINVTFRVYNTHTYSTQCKKRQKISFFSRLFCVMLLRKNKVKFVS